MGIKQSIWSLDKKAKLSSSKLINEKEFEDLLYGNIQMLSEDWIVLGRQIRTKNGGYIDILCLDREGNTVVVELKKNMTPREVTAQGLDYAAWVSKLTNTELADIHLKTFSKSINETYADYFHMELDEDTINSNTKIVIVAVSMDASTEDIITYLQTFNVDINILFFSVYEVAGERLLSRAWFIDETVQVETKKTAANVREWNGEFYVSLGVDPKGGRSLKDAKKYGFISASGGPWYTQTLKMLHPGDRVWVNIPHTGYVGVGRVIEESTMAKDAKFTVDDQETPFIDLPLQGEYQTTGDEDLQEYLVKVNWKYIVDKNKAVSEVGFFGNQNTVCQPKVEKWEFTIERLKKLWGITD